MKGMILTTATLLVLAAGNSFAGETGGKMGSSEQFRNLDSNQDHAISQQEAAQNMRLMDRWTQLDQNQNGQLEEAEFARFEEMESETEQLQEEMDMETDQ